MIYREKISGIMLGSKRFRFFLLIILFVLGLCFWIIRIEPNSIVINRLNFNVTSWHKEHKNLKMAVLADLHVGCPSVSPAKLDKIVELTNKEKPDVVFLLGDYVVQDVIGGKFVSPDVIAPKLAKLKAPCGIIAVLGNHDWWYNGEKVRKAFEKAGITVLENNAVRVTHNGKSFWVAGLADLWTRTPDINKTMSYITDNNPVIMLTHNPNTFKTVPARVSLTLAGHRHGCGQVSLCFWGKVGLPFLDNHYHATGYIKKDGRSLFISTGIGTSEMPVRFGTPPEIVIIKLDSKKVE
jgi:uncharacterized protein